MAILTGITDFFKKSYPFLAAALSAGGLPGQLAAQGLGAILKVDPSKVTPATVDQLAAATGDPDIMLKLKQAENDFQLQMKKLDIDSFEAFQASLFADKANARAREVAVKDKTPMILAYSVAGLSFLVEGLVIFHGVPATVDGVVLGRVLGTLDSALIMVLSYYFGSSAGSSAKDATINSMIGSDGTTPAAPTK